MLSDRLDTTNEAGRGLFSIYERYNQVRLGVYIQNQFQLASDEGIKSFAGGNFSEHSNNRFMVRRARLKVDYLRLNNEKLPSVAFLFQIDATERGANVRDLWGRVYENRFNLFSITTGILARPFGNEVNVSSGDRESPERGRMSQILMKTERDLGMMLRFEAQKSKTALRGLRIDMGLFNGPGLSTLADFDNHKDWIGRLYYKDWKPAKWKGSISGGISGYWGGIENASKFLYTTNHFGSVPVMTLDSSIQNIGTLAERRYMGADVQIKVPNRWGYTEVRGEVIRGRQTGTPLSSESPFEYPVMNGQPSALSTRSFDGAYFYLLQNVINKNSQIILKYDWYDPNTQVKGLEISKLNGFTSADIKYATLGCGILHYLNPNTKITVYYDRVWNEETSIPGFIKDLDDNVFTFRVQFKF